MTTYKQIIYDGGDKVLVDMAKKAQKLNTARSINVTDADGSHTGTAASFDGSGDVNIKLPATIKADLVGNADTATSAGHQTTADSATSAGHATSADSATTATSATTAGTAASASKAAKLSTARTIQTNLASGAAASFDGSADVTPGVSGILPIASGGTGSNTQNWVDLTNNQDINGYKTFTFADIAIKNTNFIRDQTPTIDINPILFTFRDQNNDVASRQFRRQTTDGYIAYLIQNYRDNQNWSGIRVLLQPNGDAFLRLEKTVNNVNTATIIASL